MSLQVVQVSQPHLNANPMISGVSSIFSKNRFRVFQNLSLSTQGFVQNKFSLHENKKKNHFHINGYALNLALKQRLGLTQKRRIVWPIKTVVENPVHQSELEATLTCTGAKCGKAHATKSRLSLLFTFHRSRGFNQSTVLRHRSEETSNFFSWRSCDVTRYLEDATIIAARSDLDLEAVFLGN